jgi:hypothetical protein
MSKAIEGAAMLGGAAAIGAGMIFATGGLGAALNAPFMIHAMEALALGGLSMEAGAIASALTSNRGMGITTRQPAAFRQFIVGEQRVGGVIVYQSTTGSKHDQYNFVIAFAGHEIENYVNLYLDGRQVFWDNGAYVNVRNGVYFGGNADGNNHTGPDGQQYNFGGKVFCSPYFGDQTFGPDSSGGVAIPGGGFSTSLYANDPTWGPGAGGTLPCLMGCAYIYLKIEYDTTLFPSLPEIKVTVRGKNDIFDPRTGTRGYSTNWALLVADQITDTTWGLGDTDGVNQDQLIAAANVCDEAVDVAATGTTEARYSCHFHDDSSVDPWAASRASAANGTSGRRTGRGRASRSIPAPSSDRCCGSPIARSRTSATASRAPTSRPTIRTTPRATCTTATASTTATPRTTSPSPFSRRTIRSTRRIRSTAMPPMNFS